ncbi:acyltransferase family protein [Oceaniglobus ichthyenteri]|uniref:acyltransferase family protein n=1 Tax=Oceaniglobus ichthyenteri TaxID=2136177 RepID=UPI0013DDD160|nr:acyltransferase family protein [Oceaniglobus ichthyenteri]
MTIGRQNAAREIRHDIDGLRALSVLIVLFYHVGFSDFGGGFIGVDVFFVISGYLIIPAVFKQSAAGTFSARDFMLRRFRRLVPALLPVLAFSGAVGLLYLSDSAFVEFLNSAFAASGFFSNYLFLAQSGYFERSSDTILLLHTWSLGVEFQFYLILAVLPFVVKSRMTLVLILFAGVSLIWAEYLVQNADNRAFFGIVPRFWELAIGGILGLSQGAFARFARFGWIMRLVGLCVIVTTAVLYRSALPFPGLGALLPIIGAGLVVAAPAQKSDPSFWFLTNRVMRWIGTRSYSIYLWHWPLIVALKLIMIIPNEGERMAIALLAFPLAELSYRFFERPVRTNPWWRLPKRSVAVAVIPLIMVGFAWTLEKQTSLISTARTYLPLHDARVITALADTARSDYIDHLTNLGMDGRQGLCSLDTYETVPATLACLETATQNATRGAAPGDQPVLIIGDSHGRDMLRTIGYAFPKAHLVMLHSSGCAPAQYTVRANRHCFPGLNDNLSEVLSIVQPKLVILASHWPIVGLSPTSKTLTDLDRWGGEVLVIGPGPKFQNPTVSAIRGLGLNNANLTPDTRLPARFDFDVAAAHRALVEMAQPYGFHVYNRLAALCDPDGCLAFVPGDDLTLMNFDDQHLTESGMRFLARDLGGDPAIRALMLPPSPK